MSIEGVIARAFQLLLALTGAYTVALWFALIVWTFRDIESRSRSVIAQIFSTLVVVLFFVPGALIYLILRPRETLDEAFGRALEEEYLLQDLEDLSLCANCHRPVRDDFIACPYCYTELRQHCHSCARLVDLSWSICPYCTTDLTGEPDDTQEAPWEERPRLAPHPLRVLRERTEVSFRHSRDFGPPEEAPRLTEGDPALQQPLLARETHTTGSWTDDTSKRSWIITRAREVFAPLLPTELAPDPNGHGEHDQPNGHHTNGVHYEESPPARDLPEPTAHDDDLNGHAPAERGAPTDYRSRDGVARDAGDPAMPASGTATNGAAPAPTQRRRSRHARKSATPPTNKQ